LEDDVWREEMKRQHPDNPDLFWCPKCETYKVKDEFRVLKHRGGGGVCAMCRSCERDGARDRRKRNPDNTAEYMRKKRKNEPDKIKKAQEKYNASLKGKLKNRRHVKYYNHLHCQNISDQYVKKLLSRCGYNGVLTTDIVDLKREQIMMHRELGQIKKEVHNGTTGKGNTGTQEPEKGLQNQKD
jgi:uncharacterized short protein YbdD (DUF466 family)